jgi:hypothetical protein
VLSSAFRLIYVKVLGAIAFLLATTVAVMAETIPLPRARPVGIPGDLTSAETAMSPCRSRLAEIAVFKPLPSITGPGDCTATDVVAMDAVVLADGHRVALSPTATLRCPMAEAVTQWIRDDVAPTIAALGKSLRDVRAFKLANGAAIELTDANVAKSLREKFRQSACARFSTVLGNGADAYHDNHVHLDLIERSNHYRICQWDVLDVAETAALAAKKATTAAASLPAVVPLPRPRPVISTALSDRPRQRSVRLREGARGPLFSLFAPLLKGMPR